MTKEKRQAGHKKREAAPLADTLRRVTSEILKGLEQEYGMSQTQMARQLGLPPTTYMRLHSVEARRGADLRTLSTVLNGLRMSPIEFYSMHPKYRGESGALPAEAKDALYARFRETVATPHAEAVLSFLRAMDREGLMPALAEAMRVMSRAMAEAQTRSRLRVL